VTEPAEETTPTAPIASGGHDGQVYVHNPLTGEVKLVDPGEASTLVYSHGFQPLSKDDAIRTDSDQILKESITPVDSITQGLGRGLSAGLTDLLPRSAGEERERAATDQAFPWLTPISEGAGFLAPFGLSAGLGAIGEGVTGALRGGEEMGLLGRAATRAAGMGTEGATYGGIGAAREAKTEDTPLTAQKLLSGMFGGGIIGGALGAGTGAIEGSGSILRGMFKDSAAAREELNAPGLRDSDVASILDRAGIPHQPGALDQLQAMLYNDPNITPEFMAAMKASPGIRDDVMLAAHPARAKAEAEFASALNDLHEGNQEALRGWSGRLKREQAENWIGPDREHISDSGNLVEMMKMLDVPGRFNLAQDIVEAVERAGKANPEAFNELINSVSARNGEEALKNVDRALLHGNKDVLDHLFSSRLLNDENIAKLKIPEASPVDLANLQEADRRALMPKYSPEEIAAHRAKLESFRVTPEEQQAIKAYSFGHDEAIRQAQNGLSDTEIKGLRRASYGDQEVDKQGVRHTQHAAEARKYSAVLDEYMRHAPVSDLPNVYRGLVIPPDEAQAFISQNTIDLGDAVQSVSSDPAVARSFVIRNQEPGQVGVVLKIEQKSARGIEHLADERVQVERELLLPRKTRLQVVERYRDPLTPDNYVIVAREIPNEGAHTSQGNLRKLLRLEPKTRAIEPAWKSAALDYVDKHIENLAELSAQPKGYLASEGAGDLRKMEGLLKGARESIMAGDRANAFSELDFVKKRVGAVRGGGYIATGEGVRNIAQGMHEEARALLENPELWGQKAASAQKEMNALLHQRLTRDSDFYKAFYSGAGMPDPKNPWVEKMVADPAKIKDVMNRVVNPENSLELGIFKKHIAESEQLADIMKRFYSLDEGQKGVVDAMSKSSKVADSAMDNAMHYNLRINQGKILSQVAHGGARGAFGSIAAYALGGPLGLAGATVGRALMNPGRLWRMQAIVERMLGSHGGRVADGIAGIVGRAGGAIASATKGSVRAVGSLGLLAQDVMTRQQAYGSTLHDLAAIASNRDHVVKALASWHGPDLAHLPNAIPGMADSIQRAAQFCLSVAPARPEPGIFSDDELGLISASEAEEFSNTVHAAMDPAMTLAMMRDGRLTPQVLKAADTAAPELMQDMRGEISNVLMSTSGAVKIDPLAQQGLAMLLGVTPSPHYTIALQSSWTSNETKPTAKVSPGSLGDTGVNDRYSMSKFSEADRLESGEMAQ